MAGSSIINETTDLVLSGREMEERRCDYVCVVALVDVTAPRSLAIPVRDALDPRLPSSEVRVVAAGSEVDLLAPTVPDVCVAVLGRNTRAVSAGVCELAAAGVPVALVCESALDAPKLPLGATAARRVSIISATNPEVLAERLAEWIIGATDKGIAMAANFPFCRRAKVRSLINEYAMDTAVRTAKLGPGAKAPSMTASQARLALAIAAVNGQPLAFGRIPEVLSAIGAGFGSRMLSNKTLGKVPIVGFMLQAGVSYLGTQATGMSLQRRFDKKERIAEGGQPEHGMAYRLASAVASHAGKGSSKTEARLLPSGDIVYGQGDAR